MTARRQIGSGLALAAILSLLVACGLFGGDEPPPPPPPPTILSLTLKATSSVNPDQSGVPKPIVVRVYRLASAEEFAEADFFQLRDGAEDLLDDDLIAVDEFTLAPGSVEVYQREFEDDARWFGVVGAYRDINNSAWRAYEEVPRNQTTLLVGEFGAEGVTLKKPGL